MSAAWLLVLPVATYFVGGYAFAHRIRASKFASRADASFSDIYKAHFQNVPENEARKWWMEAAKTLRVAPEKLRPEDSFDKELSYCLKVFPFVDLNDDFFAAVVGGLKAKRLSADEAKKWKTLGEYVIGMSGG
jgi:hypothetical protein